MEFLDLDQRPDLWSDLFCFEIVLPPCGRIIAVVAVYIIMSIYLKNQGLVHVAMFFHISFSSFIEGLIDGFVFFCLKLVEYELILADAGESLKLAHGQTVTSEEKLKISVPGSPKADIILTDTVIVGVEAFAEVKIPSHITVIKKNVLNQIADEVACPVERGIIFVVVDIFFFFNIQFLQMSAPDGTSYGEKEDKKNYNGGDPYPIKMSFGTGYQK